VAIKQDDLLINRLACRQSRDVTLVHPNTTIRDAAKKMRADDIGALPVGENDRLIGMVTDRDIAMRRCRGPRARHDARARCDIEPHFLLF
jgi:CBS-domain-containing membrane protein